MKKSGIVYLVGAGPGDPGLITVKGVECLKKADLVVYDYLANEKFLDFVPAHAKKIYVGKKGAFHAKEQADINQLLINAAKKRKVVVRLKGGDPFVFGRGGEEAEALVDAGISFEVVPGVTSPIAVPAYAGIPVTHRDFGSGVAFVTGHEKDAAGAMPPDWKALAQIETVVFLMGWGNLSNIVKNLIEAGRDASTPIAVIEWGTLPRQRKVIGALSNIETVVQKAKIRPPTIIVVGPVVSLTERLSWFEKKPLFGKKILVTRSRTQASELTRLLEDQGAEVIEFPTIEILPPTSWKGLDQAVARLSSYDWLIFTSANAVKIFFERLVKKKKDFRDLASIKIAVVGATTGRKVEEKGIKIDLKARYAHAEGLLKSFGKMPMKNRKILFPRAKEGNDVLVKELKKRGAKIELIEAYRTRVPLMNPNITFKNIDVITFASSATVDNFIQILEKSPLTVGERAQIKAIPVVTIGPMTTKTAKAHNFQKIIPSKKASMEGMVSALKCL